MFCLLAERNIRNEHNCQYPGCNARYEISELVEEEKLMTKFFAPYIIGAVFEDSDDDNNFFNLVDNSRRASDRSIHEEDVGEPDL